MTTHRAHDPSPRGIGPLPALVLGLVAASFALPAPAAAQAPAATAEAAPGWQFNIIGYLWMSGIKTSITSSGGRTASQDYGFGQIIDHLHGIPVMGAAELRYDRFGLLGDLIHLPAGGNISTPGELFRGGSVNMKTTIGTVVGLYRPIIDGASFLDVGGGMRAYGISALTTLHAGQIPGRSISAWASTVDPIISARGHISIGNGFGLDMYGDVGGFGVGTRLSYQLLGGLDYQLSQSVNLKLGYRYLRADMEKKDASVTIGGPFLAASYRF